MALGDFRYNLVHLVRKCDGKTLFIVFSMDFYFFDQLHRFLMFLVRFRPFSSVFAVFGAFRIVFVVFIVFG